MRDAPEPRADGLALLLRQTGGYLARKDRPFLARGYVQLLSRLLPGREIEIADLWGHRQIIDTRDQMGANALVGRYGLPPEVVHKVKPGDWVIDCGANIGIISSQLCAEVGRSGNAWACEPVADNVRRLEALKQVNQLDQLQIFPFAIGAAPGTTMIGLPGPGHSGWASITKSFGIAERCEVTVETIDRLAERSAPPGGRLTLLKIDVEGYEFEVLEGATGVIGAHRPVIYCEFNDVLLRDRGRSSRELLDAFADLGYRPPAPQDGPGPRLEGRVVNLLLEG